MWFNAESTTNDNESIETTQDHGTVDVSVDVGDDNDLGDTGTVKQSHVTAQSALPEVSCSMQTGRCLGEKHVGPSQPHCLSIRRQKQENKTDPLTKTGSKSFLG